MIDIGTANVTPVSEPPYFQQYRDRGATPLSDWADAESQQTAIVGFVPPAILRAAVGGLTSLDLRQIPQIDSNGSADDAELSVIDTYGESRLALLVQKYEGQNTREDSARLEILTQRLRRLSPRVTTEDLTTLTFMVEQIEEISTNMDELRTKFELT